MMSLIWKEWHEQRWKLAFGCLILSALAVIGLRSRVVADETLLMWVCMLGVTLLPVLTSMGLIAAERGEGTFDTLLALPVPAWRILIAKTSGGIILCAAPMIVAGVLSIAVAGGREMTASEIVELFGRSIAASLSLFAWMFALTIRLPTEARAGMLSLGVLACWLLLTGGLYAVVGTTTRLSPEPPARLWLLTPFIFTFGYHADWIPRAAPAVFAQTLIAALLFAFASRQIKREDRA
jgi:ABC-type transport system involved in multi-copper enzyme maturation permease subunit